MVKGVIGEGVIRIALAGFDLVKRQVAELGATTKKVTDSLSSIGTASSVGFAAAKATLLGFVAAADPVRFGLFKAKLEILAIYIGITFIPLLQKAINQIDRLIDFFKGLTDAQREQILHWTELGLKVLAVGAAFSFATMVGGKIVGVLRTLGTVIAALSAMGSLGLVVALGAIAVALYEVLKASGALDPILSALQELFSGFAPVFAELGAAFKDAIAVLMPSLSELFNAVIEAGRTIFPALVQVAVACADALLKILPAVVQLVAALTPLLAVVVALAAKLLALGADVLAKLVTVLAETFDAFWSAFGDDVISLIGQAAEVITNILGVLGELINVVMDAGRSVFPIFAQVLTAIGAALAKIFPVIVQLVSALVPLVAVVVEIAAKLAALAAGVIGELVTELAKLLESFMKTFGPGIVGFIQGCADVIKAVLDVVMKMVQALRDAAELANKLNPLSGRTQKVTEASASLKDQVERPEFVEKLKQQLKDSGKSLEEFLDAHRLTGAVRDKVRDKILGVTPGKAEEKKPEKPGPKFSPMIGLGKVEQFGIEEAFRKAQRGAAFDPARLADMERLKLMKDGLESVREIAVNTAKGSTAHDFGGGD